MRIIVLGAGQVGRSLVEHLAGEANDITVVDIDKQRLQMVQERFDVKVLCAPASHPVTLSRAGAEDADMLVAVTNSDEINMIACQVAQSLFNVPRKIARVREPGYMEQGKALFAKVAVPVDVLINPEATQADSFTDPSDPARLQMWSDVYQKVMAEAPWVPVFNEQRYTMKSERMGGADALYVDPVSIPVNYDYVYVTE